MTALALAADRQTAIREIGKERLRVAVIDDCLAAPDAAIDLAAKLSFTPIGPYYPGVRAALGADRASMLGAALGDAIDEALGLRPEKWTGECYFSIVTIPPGRLMPIQRMPHFDGVEETRVAALLFLARADYGGTSFYRHRTSGYETVNERRYPGYAAALEADVKRHGLPPADYIGDGAPIFEEIASFEPVFNRMLIYRGNALHCSRMKNVAALNADPRAGRLTLNLFLQPA